MNVSVNTCLKILCGHHPGVIIAGFTKRQRFELYTSRWSHRGTISHDNHLTKHIFFLQNFIDNTTNN